MSRIATITAVLSMLVAPAAFARPADLRAPDQQVPPAAVSAVDLRSPDAVDVFVPSGRVPQPTLAPQSAPDDGLSTWAIVGFALAALGSCGGLVVLVRRSLRASGRPAHV